MDRESNMSEEDMEMRNFFKSTLKIYPPLRGSAVPRCTCEGMVTGGFKKIEMGGQERSKKE